MNKNRILVGFIPRQIEDNREDEYGTRLVGFPVNIYYARGVGLWGRLRNYSGESSPLLASSTWRTLRARASSVKGF
jgi:hypothetical protein